MLTFPCPICPHQFALPDDEAGRDVQCPDCGILVSVPLASDLDSLNPDGTLKLADDPVARGAEPGRLDGLRRSFGWARVDDDGNEIDNRTMPDALELTPVPGGPARVAPAYDPETGELVRPIELAREAPVPAVPVDEFAPAAVGPGGQHRLGYRPRGSRTMAGADEARRVEPGRVWVALLRPLNAAVMTMVFVAHFLFGVSAIVVGMGIFFFFLAPLVLFFLIVGHYGNVVDEVSTADMDELPRPLRHLGWSDDLWGPFCDVFLTLMLVAAPALSAVAAWGAGGLANPLVLAWVGGGTVAALLVAPAVLLTLRTSGSALNLRPDRVLGVVRACGRDYLPVMLIGLAAIPACAGGTAASIRGFFKSFGVELLGDWGRFGGFVPTQLYLVVGIYLGHLFCWRVGLLYRLHQPDFPWVLQEAVRADRAGRPRTRTSAAERQAWIAAREAERHARRLAAMDDAARRIGGR